MILRGDREEEGDAPAASLNPTPLSSTPFCLADALPNNTLFQSRLAVLSGGLSNQKSCHTLGGIRTPG